MHRLLLATVLCAASTACLAHSRAAPPPAPAKAQAPLEVGAPFHRQVRQRAPIGPRAQRRSRDFVHPEVFLPALARDRH